MKMPDEMHNHSYLRGMNKLPLAKRVQILSMLCEGSSMRSISRVADVSTNTVTKLLVEAGETCLAPWPLQPARLHWRQEAGRRGRPRCGARLNQLRRALEP